MGVRDFVINPARFFVPKEGRGECVKCFCHEFKPLNFWDPEKREYPPRKMNDEKRCTRCGRLLLNHNDINHPFQESL